MFDTTYRSSETKDDTLTTVSCVRVYPNDSVSFTCNSPRVVCPTQRECHGSMVVVTYVYVLRGRRDNRTTTPHNPRDSGGTQTTNRSSWASWVVCHYELRYYIMLLTFTSFKSFPFSVYPVQVSFTSHSQVLGECTTCAGEGGLHTTLLCTPYSKQSLWVISKPWLPKWRPISVSGGDGSYMVLRPEGHASVFGVTNVSNPRHSVSIVPSRPWEGFRLKGLCLVPGWNVRQERFLL